MHDERGNREECEEVRRRVEDERIMHHIGDGQRAYTDAEHAQVSVAFLHEAHSRPEYRAMMLVDKNFGEIAMRNIDEWVSDIRSLRRKILEHNR